MEREKKKRVDDNTWRERKGRSKKREREESANTHRLAAVYTQLALPRVLHQLTSSSFWSSQATRIPQQLETLPTTTTITTTTRSRCPSPPLFHSREKDLPRGFGSRGGVERLSRTMISREREKTGRETAWLSRTTYKSAPIATLDLSRAFALVFHFDVHVCKKEKKEDW